MKQSLCVIVVELHRQTCFLKNMENIFCVIYFCAAPKIVLVFFDLVFGFPSPGSGSTQILGPQIAKQSENNFSASTNRSCRNIVCTV